MFHVPPVLVPQCGLMVLAPLVLLHFLKDFSEEVVTKAEMVIPPSVGGDILYTDVHGVLLVLNPAGWGAG